ncbi:MAG: tetratricopeptide repeat protein [bacterium]
MSNIKFDEAMELYYNDDESCFEMFMEMLDETNDEVFHMIGICYKEGLGVSKDIDEAVKYLDKAIVLGNIDALSSKGLIYYSKKEKDNHDKAYYLFSKAAKAGSEDGYLFLGDCHHYGIGTAPNIDKAIECYSKIPEEENALFGLGLCYCNRSYDNLDLNKAMYYFEQSAFRGNVTAMYRLADLYCYHNRHEEAVSWYEVASSNGDDKSQQCLAEYYLEGKYVEKDVNKAIELLEQSIEKNNDEAYFLLHKIYDEGIHVEKDSERALAYLICAADLSHFLACTFLAMFYYYSNYGLDDKTKVLHYLKKIEHTEDDFVYFLMGECYYHGVGVEVDLRLAKIYYVLAAKDGLELAKEALLSLV